MVLKAITKFILSLLFNILNGIVSFIWLSLPLWFHVFLVQMREKIDVIQSLDTYFNPNSTWTAVYDGVVIVNTAPGALRKKFDSIISWFRRKKHWFIILAVLITLGLLGYVAYKIS